MANFICSNEKYKLSVLENMEDGKSYVTIRVGHDEVTMPMEAFRYMNQVWNKNGWDKEWDTLAVTDKCFPKEQ